MKKADILIFGDICPDNDYKALYGKSDTPVFDEKIRQMMDEATFVVGNLECPATNETAPITKCGPTLKAEPEDVAFLKKMGLDAVSLANNHILDYGEEAVNETVACCQKNGLLYFGAGKNTEEAAKPLVTEIGGKKIGFLSFAEAEFNLAGAHTPGANHYDVYTSLDDIAALKQACDYVAVLYHGGIEHYKNPSPLLQKKCRAMAKAGADLVLCQHSHCIGTIEKWGDTTILYGQGNTAFGYREGNAAWNEGFAVAVHLDTNSISLYLMQATPGGIVLASEEANKNRINRLKSDSERIGDAEFIKEQWDAYCAAQEALDLALVYGKNRVYNKLNRILHNALMNTFYKGKKQMITMNLIRCEAHHEVVTTILENNVLKNK